MEQPNLPYWFYSGQLAVTIDGPVYVLKSDGTVVGVTGPAVIVPRSKFFATQRATSHLVSRKLIKRLADPKRPVAKEAAPAAAPVKSEPLVAPASEPQSASSEPEQKDAVIASEAGDGAAGSSSSEPEEQESSSRRRSRRS